MKKPIDVVVAGHLCLDIIPTILHERIEFEPGRLLQVGPAVLSTGGAVSNTGLALHKLGIPTRLMGKTGRDSFGAAIREIVAGHDPDLNEGMSVVEGEATSYSIIISTPGQDRMFLHCPGCNDTFGAEDIDYAMLAKARVFHFGYPPLMRRMIEEGAHELVALFARAHETGATTVLDMCMPDPDSLSGRVDWPSILAATLPHVDVYLPSFEETMFMLDPEERRLIGDCPACTGVQITPSRLAETTGRLLRWGPKIVGLKLGSLGLYLRTAGRGSWKSAGRGLPQEPGAWTDREIWSPCFSTTVVGTTGSGDATIAGFLAAVLRGNEPEECVTLACAVGACNVEAADALGGLRSWEETLGRLRAGWPRADLDLAAQGWRRCEPTGVWLGPRDALRE